MTFELIFDLLIYFGIVLLVGAIAIAAMFSIVMVAIILKSGVESLKSEKRKDHNKKND